MRTIPDFINLVNPSPSLMINSHKPASLGQSYELIVSVDKHYASIYIDYKADKRLLHCLQD